MKFVAIIDPRKKGKDRITSFVYKEAGPVPPIVDPEKPEETKDGGVSTIDEEKPKKPRPS